MELLNVLQFLNSPHVPEKVIDRQSLHSSGSTTDIMYASSLIRLIYSVFCYKSCIDAIEMQGVSKQSNLLRSFAVLLGFQSEIKPKI